MPNLQFNMANIPLQTDEMQNLCICVKSFLQKNEIKKAEEEICYAMYLHPHASAPHNLMGILLEKLGDHTKAMQHFRVAIDLDPTYLPAKENLYTFAEFHVGGIQWNYGENTQ